MSEDSREMETVRIGDTLRKAREARGLTLGDVSRDLLVREDYLRAIEDMYANGVPKGYLSGILRTYAGLLGLPAEQTVKTFSEQCGAISQTSQEPAKVAPIAAPSQGRKVLAMAAGALALVCVGGVTMMALSHDETVAAPIIEAGSAVNGARESLFAVATADELSAQLPLTLTANTAAWLEVRGADGTIFRSRKMAEGEVYHPRIGAGWTVTVRDGSAFSWHVGDIEIGPLAASPSPVFAMSVDAVAVEAQAITAPALAAVGESTPSR